jgi:hypothetical protein
MAAHYAGHDEGKRRTFFLLLSSPWAALSRPSNFLSADVEAGGPANLSWPRFAAGRFAASKLDGPHYAGHDGNGKHLSSSSMGGPDPPIQLPVGRR